MIISLKITVINPLSLLGWIRGSTKAFVNKKELSYSNHTHQDIYYTKSQVDNLISQASGPKVVWSSGVDVFLRGTNNNTIISNIPANVTYIEFIDYNTNNKYICYKNRTVSIPVYQNNISALASSIFTGTVFKLSSNSGYDSWKVTGNIIGYRNS